MRVAADASRVLVYLYFGGGGAHQKNIEATHSCDLSPEDTRTKLPAPPRSLVLLWALSFLYFLASTAFGCTLVKFSVKRGRPRKILHVKFT